MHLINHLQNLIEEYYERIRLAQGNLVEIIYAIAKFAHQADILHPFCDGNVRTFVFLIVNKLLLENELLPAIFADPNRFDGYSIYELCLEIINGQKAWLFVAAKEGYLDLAQHIAAQNGYLEVVKALLKSGANPLQECNLKTPEQIAIENGRTEIIDLLHNLQHISTLSV